MGEPFAILESEDQPPLVFNDAMSLMVACAGAYSGGRPLKLGAPCARSELSQRPAYRYRRADVTLELDADEVQRMVLTALTPNETERLRFTARTHRRTERAAIRCRYPCRARPQGPRRHGRWTMNADRDASLEAKLREWFERPQIKQSGWAPRLFWKKAADGGLYGALRGEALELEVFFAALLGEPSSCAGELESLRPQRPAFLAANARRHELPLFTTR